MANHNISSSDLQSAKTIRLRSFYRGTIILLAMIIYTAYTIGGLIGIASDGVSIVDISHNLLYYILYCMKNPLSCYNDKTPALIGIAVLIWAITSLQRYQKLSYNLIHGKEYGEAKWGDIDEFNKKYAAPEPDTPGFNKEQFRKTKPTSGTASKLNSILTSSSAKIPITRSIPNKPNRLFSYQTTKTPFKTLGTKAHTALHPTQESPNRILSERIRFRYSADTLRNNNTIVVGGSGAGKTSFFLTPNLINNHGCNIVVDPKGSLVEELGPYLRSRPHTQVYTLNLCEMEKSDRINPFLFIRTRTDITRLIKNYIQNTNNPQIKTNTADPFWERSEQMFLESIFLYVWMECPQPIFDKSTGNIFRLERNWRTILYLIDEAQFISPDTPPKLDIRMTELAKKNAKHPAVKAYRRYRSGPEETVRSVIMTVNARMQAFDNDELMRIFSGNDIPLDNFGVGKDGDGITKTTLFIVIPDDDDTYNFVPGMIYTLLFKQLYAQARLFGGRLPMDVGFWLDEFANTKMPSNFDKVLATCRSRGIYCVPMLQSLSQLKTLFENGAWEGVVGNCDTFLYLGGNEPSTYEYISKALGKWTVDKRTSGESHGSSGSSSENYDVLGRELMMEYEVRLLPDDECILFVRGELPLRDKKWLPWEHKEYEYAVGCKDVENTESVDAARFVSDITPSDSDQYSFINSRSLNYLKKSQSNIKVVDINPLDFMMVDLDRLTEETKESVNDALKGSVSDSHESISDKPISDYLDSTNISIEKISKIIERNKATRETHALSSLKKNFDNMSILDIYASDAITDTRRQIITEMIKSRTKDNPVTDEEIKSVISPDRSTEEVVRMFEIWKQMRG